MHCAVDPITIGSVFSKSVVDNGPYAFSLRLDALSL